MSAACNIGPKGVRARWIGGLAMVAVAMGAFFVPSFREMGKVGRLLLFVPLLVAFLSLYQAREKT